MFGILNKKKNTDTLRTDPAKPLPVPHKHYTESLSAYEALAEELGFRPAQLLRENLLRFLSEVGIPTYNYTEVDAYLEELAEKQNKNWIWRPLREKDRPDDWDLTGRITRRNRYRGNGVHGHGNYHHSYLPYNKAVPIHILRQVKKIQDKFGDEVLFFVSDYEVPVPDPFIMVVARDMELIVFGVWDEPGFGIDSKV